MSLLCSRQTFVDNSLNIKRRNGPQPGRWDMTRTEVDTCTIICSSLPGRASPPPNTDLSQAVGGGAKLSDSRTWILSATLGLCCFMCRRRTSCFLYSQQPSSCFCSAAHWWRRDILFTSDLDVLSTDRTFN